MAKKAKKKKPKKVIKKLWWMIYLLILAIIILALFQFGFYNYLSNFFEEPITIDLGDECSLFLGRIIHQVNDGGECKMRCIAECESRTINFDNSEFGEKENDCHSCVCYCKK